MSRKDLAAFTTRVTAARARAARPLPPEWGRCFGKYYGMIDLGDITPTDSAPDGTPLVPYAASGPNQFVMGPRWWPSLEVGGS